MNKYQKEISSFREQTLRTVPYIGTFGERKIIMPPVAKGRSGKYGAFEWPIDSSQSFLSLALTPPATAPINRVPRRG